MIQLRSEFPSLQVLMFTGEDKTAGVEALKRGAFRYFLKPFDNDDLALAIRAMADACQQQACAREAGWLQALLQISQNALLLPREQVLSAVTSTVRDLFSGTVSILWVPEAQSGLLKVGSWAGDLDDQYREFVVLSMQADAMQEFINKRQPVGHSAVVDSREASHLTEEQQTEARKREWISVLSVPLVAEDHFAGILDIYWTNPRVFSEQDYSLISAFASQAASIVWRPEIEDSRNRLLQALQTVSALTLSVKSDPPEKVRQDILDKAVKAIHELTGDDAALWLPDGDSGEWKIHAHLGLREEYVAKARFGPKDSISGQAIQYRQNHTHTGFVRSKP